MHSSQSSVPIITIDGPSASGKGSVASLVASKLGFHYLDSGAIYRSLAYFVRNNYAKLLKHDTIHHNNSTIVNGEQFMSAKLNENNFINQIIDNLLPLLTTSFQLEFREVINQGKLTRNVMLNGDNITDFIYNEKIGAFASFLAKFSAIREPLLAIQRNFARPLGLVTDGRDMGSVVFPQAKLKIFLNAEVAIRAKRRFLELQKIDSSVTMATILQSIMLRDEQDKDRICAPLTYDASFRMLDSSYLTIEESVEQIIAWFHELCALDALHQ